MDLFQKCHGFTRAREVQAEGFYPYFVPIGESEGTEVTVDGHRIIMAGSNNYLGLTHHPHVLEAVHAAIENYGSSCTGSRFLNGTLELHEELERRLAKFLKRESVLVFSGFVMGVNTFFAVAGVFILRRREVPSGAYRTFGYPVTPLIFLVLMAWTLTYILINRPEEGFAGLGIILTGALAYWFSARHNRSRPEG